LKQKILTHKIIGIPEVDIVCIGAKTVAFLSEHRFFSPKVKISHRMVNPPTEYRQFIINQFPHGEISTYKAKKGLPTYGIFPLKKQICKFSGKCKCSLKGHFL
jgi:hypothetical protein